MDEYNRKGKKALTQAGSVLGGSPTQTVLSRLNAILLFREEIM